MFNRLTIALLLTCCTVAAGAQTFVNRLRTPVKGQGRITVTHDAEIDALVNGASASAAQKQTKAAVTASKPAATETRKTNTNTATAPKTESAQETADAQKKPTGRSYKVDGYRVQAYAGGNTRRDRQAAEQTGNSIKAKFPSEQIYVHFYSPRWICRVGNYRTYEEAHRMLLAIQGLGYKQASIVKGKITVQY